MPPGCRLQNGTIGRHTSQLTSRRAKGISIRRAPGPAGITSPSTVRLGRQTRHLRLAVAKSRPPPGSTTASPATGATLNNHVFVAGQDGYRDNNGVVAYNRNKRNGSWTPWAGAKRHAVREDGYASARIRSLFYDAQSTRRSPRSRPTHPGADRRQTRARRPVGSETAGDYAVGKLDIAQFGWVGRRVSRIISSPRSTLRTGKQLRPSVALEIDAAIEHRYAENSIPARRGRGPARSTS